MEDGNNFAILNDDLKVNITQESKNEVNYKKGKDDDGKDTCDLVNWRTLVSGITMEDQPVDAFIGIIVQGVICTNENNKVLLHPFMKNVGILFHRQDNYVLNGWLNHIILFQILSLPNIGKV